MRKVLIGGTFDIIHPGHLQLINQARQLGDRLIIVIARDRNVIKAKGRPPHFNEQKRLENLTNLLAKIGKLKNYQIILGDLADPYQVVLKEKPQLVALGYDQQFFVNGLHDLVVNSDLACDIERLEPFKERTSKSKILKKALADAVAGFLLINKPAGWTSFQVVAKLRSITGLKKIGHTGTLDPLATGLLICALGQATKLTAFFDILPKTYEAVIKLGVISDTYDRTGKITRVAAPSAKLTSTPALVKIIDSFLGKQQQLPPMFSAKKVGGRKLYELARQGQEITRRPANIEIYNIELMAGKIIDDQLKIKVQCSTGTYIRTLAHDLGQKMGSGAIIQELTRTAIGDFSVQAAAELNNLDSRNFPKWLIRPLEAINLLNESYGRHVFG